MGKGAKNLMDKISCGAIIRNDDEMLVVRPTNHVEWNIPKGIKNVNESHKHAAFRETKEETGIDLYKHFVSIKVDYLGEFAYYKGKILVLFDVLFDTKDLPIIGNMKCSSMFWNKKMGIYQPEISKFKYISIENYDKYVNKSLEKVLDKIF